MLFFIEKEEEEKKIQAEKRAGYDKEGSRGVRPRSVGHTIYPVKSLLHNKITIL